jgi:hypothetical protein
LFDQTASFPGLSENPFAQSSGSSDKSAAAFALMSKRQKSVFMDTVF